MTSVAQIIQARSLIEPVFPPMAQAVAGAIKPKHIDMLIEQQTKREENRHREAIERRQDRRKLVTWVLGMVLTAVCILGGLAFGFGHPEHAGSLIFPIIGLVGVAFGAYKAGQGRTRKRQQRRSK